MKLPVQVLRSMNPLLNLRQRILNLHGYQRSARIVNQEGQLQSIRIETNYVPLVITNDLTTLKKVRLQTNTRCSCFPIFPKSWGNQLFHCPKKRGRIRSRFRKIPSQGQARMLFTNQTTPLLINHQDYTASKQRLIRFKSWMPNWRFRSWANKIQILLGDQVPTKLKLHLWCAPGRLLANHSESFIWMKRLNWLIM